MRFHQEVVSLRGMLLRFGFAQNDCSLFRTAPIQKTFPQAKLMRLQEQYLGTIPRIINSENTLLSQKLCFSFISLWKMPKIDFWSRFFFGNSGNFIRITNIFTFSGCFLMKTSKIWLYFRHFQAVLYKYSY